MNEGENVLVTGAGGFIGSHLVEQLVRTGHRVRPFLHYNSRQDPGLLALVPDEILRELDIVFGDLRDADTVRRAARDTSGIFHLGAQIGIPYSFASPRDVVETNVMGTLNVLQAALDNGIDRVLQVSTSEVYGTAMYVPMDEGHPLQAQSPYSASKIGAEKLAESYSKSFNLGVTIVRPFNCYGPRQSARAIIPTIISQAIAASEIRIGSLAPKRDFTYVGDTVEGFIRLMKSDKTIGQIINLGTNTDVSVEQLVESVGRIIGKGLTIRHDPARVRPKNSEVLRLVADATKASALCGWEPSVTLDQGLERTISWVQENAGRYRPTVYAV